MAREAFKAKIEVSYILNNESYAISSDFVKYIMCENLYESRFMPVIYISLSLDNDLYSKVSSNEKSGKVYLNIQKYNAYSGSSLYKNYIEGQFTYILSTGNLDYAEELTTETDNIDSARRSVTLALMSMELLNLSKTSFNGIYGKIDENTLIVKAMEGMPAVIQKPKYNPVYETILVPPLNSKKKLLKFIFDKCPFYDTNYMFFLDFNKSYLLDLTGEPCPSNDGQLNTVIIEVNRVTSQSSFYEGMETKNGAYCLYVNPANINVSENKGSDKVSNQLVFVDDDGTVDYVDLEINNNDDSTTKQSFKRGSNAKLYKNIAESNTVIIEIVKDNMDGSLITPNKEFIISNYDEYAEYNGNYTLLYKKEIITNNNGDYGISVTFGLRKVGNIVSLGSQIAAAAAKKASSAAGRYSTTRSSVGTTKTTTTTSKTNIAKSTQKQLPKVKHIKATTNNNASLKRIPRKV